MRIGIISKIICPSYGCCSKCKTVWKFVKASMINCSDNKGTFQLCEKCYKESSIEQRISYYKHSRNYYRMTKPEKQVLIQNIIDNNVKLL